jgi:hypothetical protein
MSAPVKILVFRNEFEALLLDEILTGKKIPHMIRSYHESAYDGLWATQSVWGHVEAREEFREDIVNIYNKMSDESV